MAESDRWKAFEYDKIEAIVKEHVGKDYWKMYRDLSDAVKALLPPKQDPDS